MRFHQRAGAALLAAGLLVPAGAAVATSANAATPIAAHQGHGKMKAKYVCYKSERQELREARSKFRAAKGVKQAEYREARKTWLGSTVSERAKRRAALAVANTDQKRAQARSAFRAETVDPREIRQTAKKNARIAYWSARSDFFEARKGFRKAKRACRR